MKAKNFKKYKITESGYLNGIGGKEIKTISICYELDLMIDRTTYQKVFVQIEMNKQTKKVDMALFSHKEFGHGLYGLRKKHDITRNEIDNEKNKIVEHILKYKAVQKAVDEI